MFCRTLCLVFVLLACTIGLKAQDEMYLKNGKVNEWKITDISPTEVKGFIAANPGVPYATARSNVLFLFNRIGNFLVIPTLNDADSSSQRYKDNFFNGVSDAYGQKDRIITTNSDIITCKFNGADGNFVNYTADGRDGRIASSDIVVIIFMNGDHKLYASTNKAFQVLNAVQQSYNNMAFAAAKSQNVASAPPGGAGAAAAVAATSADAGKSKKGKGKQSKAADNAQSPAQAPGSQGSVTGTQAGGPAPSGTVVSAAGAHQANTNGDLVLTDEQRDSCSKDAIRKVKDFGFYLQILCDKTATRDNINLAIKRAMSLFVDDQRIIEVSGPNGTKIQKNVRDYLNHLRFLAYDKIRIEWYNVQFINKFRKSPDGNYVGEVEFEQKFTATSDDNTVVYSDITRKKAEIVLQPFTVQENGIEETHWHVLLGDIGVAEIKSS